MIKTLDASFYTADSLRKEGARLLHVVEKCRDPDVARDRLRQRVIQIHFDTLASGRELGSNILIRSRDCSMALLGVLSRRAADLASFSVSRALWDIAQGRPRDDLQPGFYAEMIHWIRGLEGRAVVEFAAERSLDPGLAGREAAVARSEELDRLWAIVSGKMARYESGLNGDARQRREKRKRRILEVLGGAESDWSDWHWQIRHIITDAEALHRLVPVSDAERAAITAARGGRLAFGITPYYASLMDEEEGDRDRAVRAQVIPPQSYVDSMLEHKGDRAYWCDFMLESDTSPVDLVTRRYPAIVILKPFNTCPQICVYCQRNWEITQAMAPGALAPPEAIEAAVQWIEDHPAIREVLITGGDPLAMSDSRLEQIMRRVAAIPAVDTIRIGSRTPVTLPMRITQALADMLGSFRELGRREVVVVTHIEHPYEVTMETAAAVDKLRRAGMSVLNQQVYTFFVSRRFESAKLRYVLRCIGVEPYYTFAPKGKQETAVYRVPIARILQEQKEEARLMPGTRRTDEAVYNVPGLGKNYLRARQHRDILSVLPDGSRVYEFHPWEKNVVAHGTHVGTDVPILDYLARLAAVGEDPDDYQSIWYYF